MLCLAVAAVAAIGLAPAIRDINAARTPDQAYRGLTLAILAGCGLAATLAAVLWR